MEETKYDMRFKCKDCGKIFVVSGHIAQGLHTQPTAGPNVIFPAASRNATFHDCKGDRSVLGVSFLISYEREAVQQSVYNPEESDQDMQPELSGDEEEPPEDGF